MFDPNNKELNMKRQMEFIKQEVKLTRKLNHKHIVKYYDFQQNRTLVKKDGTKKQVTYIVQEPILGGELYSYIADTGELSEKMCRYFFKQMLQALHYLHSKGIAHRDLKPENILLDENFDIKLIDFGFAGLLQGSKKAGYMRTQLGSPPFMAPEIIEGKEYQGDTVDLFALGVILFAMRAGHAPYDNLATKQDMDYRFIINHRLDLYWKAMGQFHETGHFSEDFKDLIGSMLDYHPSRRPIMMDLIGHPWVQGELPTK